MKGLGQMLASICDFPAGAQKEVALTQQTSVIALLLSPGLGLTSDEAVCSGKASRGYRALKDC